MIEIKETDWRKAAEEELRVARVMDALGGIQTTLDEMSLLLRSMSLLLQSMAMRASIESERERPN